MQRPCLACVGLWNRLVRWYDRVVHRQPAELDQLDLVPLALPFRPRLAPEQLSRSVQLAVLSRHGPHRAVAAGHRPAPVVGDEYVAVEVRHGVDNRRAHRRVHGRKKPVIVAVPDSDHAHRRGTEAGGAAKRSQSAEQPDGQLRRRFRRP